MKYLSNFLLLSSSVLAIWPIPSEYTHGDGSTTLWIDNSVKVVYNGSCELNKHSYNSSSKHCLGDKIVANAVERTYDTLFHKNFVPWMFHPRNSDFEPSGESRTLITEIVLNQKQHQRQYERQNQHQHKPYYNISQTHHNSSQVNNDTIQAEDVDESYSLSVSVDGKVSITANTSIGFLYGLTTFTQLFFQHSDGCVYTQLAPVEIEDKPKFTWRGLNVDTSRTFKPVPLLKRTIDALSYNKMNRLHWHITDGQAWPLEIPALPELADKGAYTKDQKYTPQDVKEIQEYGALLGVEVVMEIDQPGHTSSIAFSHPELIAAFNVQPGWSSVAAEPPSGTLKLNDSKVSDFLETLFDDLLPRLDEYSDHLHLGGDEVNVNAYKLDDTVGTNATSVLQPLMQKFMDRNTKQVIAAGYTPLVWEEMLLVWNLTLPNATIVQSWLSDESVASIVSKGYRALAGNYNYWYLDCGFGQWLDFYPSTSQQYWPYNDYCNPRKNWRLMYSYDPLSGVPAESAHLVIGGEAHIWSEQTDVVNFDSKVWPRACATAEVLWSGAKDSSGQNRSQIDASPRLSEMRERLVARGVGAEPIQMPFCTMNGTQCAL